MTLSRYFSRLKMRARTVAWMAAASIGALTLISGAAQAATAFQWDEGGAGNGQFHPVPLISYHNAQGPILADDFVSAISGAVNQVTWWGSKALSDTWEITFHGNSNANDPAFPYISQHFVNAVGTDADGDGVYKFTASWTPQDTVLFAGTQYWFSVANAANGWEWALAGAGGPQVGSENFYALQSVDGDPSPIPGPHDGPWAKPFCPVCGAEVDANLAFRIDVVPVPAALPLLLTALAGSAGLARRRRRKPA